METHEVKQEVKVLSKKTLLKGTTKKIVVNKYWDSHGDEHDWGTDTTNYDSEKDPLLLVRQRRNAGVGREMH